MKHYINFQYRPADKARPEDEPMLDSNGEPLSVVLPNGGCIPSIGDHVVFCRASARRGEDGKIEPYTEQVQGVVENKIFFYLVSGGVSVNVVVTDSKVNGGLLIKE